MNSKKTGDVGLGKAIAYFTARGLTVSIPLTDSQDYDLVVDEEGVLKKVQVKTCRNKNKREVYEVGLRTRGGNRSGTGKTKYFDPLLVDYLFVATDRGVDYLIPSSEIKGKTCIALEKSKDRFVVQGSVSELVERAEL